MVPPLLPPKAKAAMIPPSSVLLGLRVITFLAIPLSTVLVDATLSVRLPSHPDLSTTAHPGPTIVYDSLPALFGLKFAPRVEYGANLHLPLDPYLCEVGEVDATTAATAQQQQEDTSIRSGAGDDDDASVRRRMDPMMRGRRTQQQSSSQSQSSSSSSRVMDMTSSHTAIALLAKRGKCTFATKARNAMLLNERAAAAAAAAAAAEAEAEAELAEHDANLNSTQQQQPSGEHRYGNYYDLPPTPRVQYLIVYDNSSLESDSSSTSATPNPHRNDGLVPMGTREDTSLNPITVASVFVHGRTGIDVLDTMAMVMDVRGRIDAPYLDDDGTYDVGWDFPIKLDGWVPFDSNSDGGGGNNGGGGGGPQGGGYQPPDMDWDDWYREHNSGNNDDSSRWSGNLGWVPLASKVFFVVLVVYPITRGMMVWYSRGGRVLIVRRPAARAEAVDDVDGPVVDEEGAAGGAAASGAAAAAGSDEGGVSPRRTRGQRRRLGRARGVLARHRLPYRIRVVRPNGGRGLGRGRGGFVGGAGAAQSEDVLSAEQVDALPTFEFSCELHAPEEEDEEMEREGEGEEEDGEDGNDAPPPGEEEEEEDGKMTRSCPTPLDGAAEGGACDDHVPPSTPTRSSTASTSSLTPTPRPSPRHASSSMCSICLDDFEDGETVRELPRCRHFFHMECIHPWLTERRGCCPLCKASVLGTDDGGGEDGRGEDEMGGEGRGGNDAA